MSDGWSAFERLKHQRDKAPRRISGLDSNMKVSVVAAQADRYAREIVATALVRSFTLAQVATCDVAPTERGYCPVWINPPDESAVALTGILQAGGKAIVLGRLGPAVADALGLQWKGQGEWPPEWETCRVDAAINHDESPAAIQYADTHALARLAPAATRPLCRFDFADEWNNLGFGRIRLDGSAWSVQSAVAIGDATLLARLVVPSGAEYAYAALRDTAGGSVLWFNRPVGPVDSLEWRIVESFLADHRADDLPCWPCLDEIPAGYAAAVCARLDCDEAIASSAALFELYQDHGLPLSLALLTGQAIEKADIDLLRRLLAAGGSVVSHSVRHEPNWGGSHQRACQEAVESRRWFDEHLPEATPVRYAVSPFHQNPTYAVQALADTGYLGFAGGIIANDPEYLLGRAGRVPFVSRPLVSLSTQCMLHGDCYARGGNSIEVYRQSFDQHLAAGATFGYLDHPFSPRYQYGWTDEVTRLAAHGELIEHIGERPEIWWASLSEVLDFLRHRDAARIEGGSNGQFSVAVASGERRPFSIRWKGRQFAY
jgi:hypothetical protein